MKKMRKIIGAVALAVLGFAGLAQAEIDTTTLDSFQTDAVSWVSYGLTVFLAVAGAGLAIVAARWVYRKIKSAISAS